MSTVKLAIITRRPQAGSVTWYLTAGWDPALRRYYAVCEVEQPMSADSLVYSNLDDADCDRYVDSPSAMRMFTKLMERMIQVESRFTIFFGLPPWREFIDETVRKNDCDLFDQEMITFSAAN
jgi:hypothetical protein